MFKLLGLLVLTASVSSFAKPSCLIDKSCIEHNGKIIDLRGEAKRSLDSLMSCNPLKENCIDYAASQPMTELSLKEFKKLVGPNGTEHFIPLEKSDLIKLAGALSLGTIVFAHDREIMDFVQKNKLSYSDEVRTFGNIAGREGILPVAAGAYFMGAVLKNGKLKQVGMFTITTAIATSIVTEVFKKNFTRVRPNGTDDPYEFFTEENYSFFSGHTSAAFSLATVIAEVYKDKPVIPYLAYGAAALTAYARMYDNKHWPSDVLMGAIAGHLITKILIRTLESADNAGKSGLVVTPEMGKDNRGGAYGGFRVAYTGQYQPEPLQCKKSGLTGNDLVSLCLEEAFARSR